MMKSLCDCVGTTHDLGRNDWRDGSSNIS